MKIRSNGFKRTKEGIQKTFHWKDALKKLEANPFCYLTGEPLNLDNFSNVCFDHIVPTFIGGDNSLENLGFCTPEVNSAKHSLSNEDFFKLCKKVLEYNGYIVTDKLVQATGVEPA